MDVSNNYMKITLPTIGDIAAIKDGNGNYIWSWMVENRYYYRGFITTVPLTGGLNREPLNCVQNGIPFRVINHNRAYTANEITSAEYCGEIDGNVDSHPAWSLNQVAIFQYIPSTRKFTIKPV